VSSGCDSGTWGQSVSDTVVINQSVCDTVTSSPVYALTEYDELIDDFYDVGTDVLGASDSILGGCDTYTWGYDRDVAANVTDSGDSATPFYVSDSFWDQVGQADTGSSKLTNNGHVYATDTFTYGEDTGATATASQSLGNGYNWSVLLGSGYDTYADFYAGTITASNTRTASVDDFNLADTWISGSTYEITTGLSDTVQINGSGFDTMCPWRAPG
jgi:hypothetical protein